MAIKKRIIVRPKLGLRIRPKPKAVQTAYADERDLPVPAKDFAAIIDYINKQGKVINLFQIDLHKWQANVSYPRSNSFSIGMGESAEEAMWIALNLHLKGGKW